MRFGTALGCVGASRLGPDVDFHFRKTRVQPPPIRDPVIGGQFDPVGFTLLPAAQDNRKRRRWTGLFHAAKVIVIIIKSRRGQGYSRMRLDAVPEFVSNE